MRKIIVCLTPSRAPCPSGTPRKSSKPLPSVDDIEMTTAEARKWLLPSRFMLRPKARLIAFPWAGGSSLVYARWEVSWTVTAPHPDRLVTSPSCLCLTPVCSCLG